MALAADQAGPAMPLLRLRERAGATADPALRGRAGELLLAVGGRLGSSGASIDRMLGLVLADEGARLTGDERRRAAVREQGERVRREDDALREALRRLGTWPFAATLPREPDRELERLGRLLR
ncbi:hypothetical protein [Anaeromyxobacter sp. PSR-1]|uniref:hypothetical protein n=1 Tax=unclassified Anaeromyxobacter TaxID=2620896 RepID=UPI0005DD1F0A|nr:hypothetical protein [Anaeromyxobacter sp. PSR-1]GAO04379.1 hypothetical protein PSR1_03273 [Anaeromyxobacter sp. PSR-1]